MGSVKLLIILSSPGGGEEGQVWLLLQPSSSAFCLDCGLGGVESGTMESVGSVLASATTNLRILEG